MTGLETVLAKAVANASGRAISWGSGALANKIADKRLTKRLTTEDNHQVASLRGVLNPEQAEELVRFLDSPEVEQLIFSLATFRMLRVCGKSIDKAEQASRSQFRVRLALQCPSLEPSIDVVDDSLYRAIVVAVDKNMGDLVGNDRKALSARTRASLVKSASAMTAASLRTSTLLEGIENLTAFSKFETELREAIAALHATMRLPHAGTTRSVPYERLFVQPIILYPQDSDKDHPAEHEPFTLVELITSQPRLLLLGDPGGGKSTTALKFVHDVAAGQTSLNATVPFLVVLRDYAEDWSRSKHSMMEFIERQCAALYSVPAPSDAVEYLLLSGNAVVVLDGLDELLNTAHRRKIVEVVEAFCNRFPLTTVIVTSRRIGYEEAPLDPDTFDQAGLGQFDSEMVEAYVRKWFSIEYELDKALERKVADGFLDDSGFVSDLTSNPLMLSLMCGIYASERYIPRNRPEVYEKCSLLLFEKWDKQRGINMSMSFDAHVQSAMRSLALWLYPRLESAAGLPRVQLVSYMKAYLREKRFDSDDSAEQAANEFIDFCKGRAWVLTDVGSELYGFTHRTFLEYFAASQSFREQPDAQRLLDVLLQHIKKAEWTWFASFGSDTRQDGRRRVLTIFLLR